MSGINKNLPFIGLLSLCLVMLLPNAVVVAAEKVAGKTLLTRGSVTSKRTSGSVVLKRRSPIFEKDEIHVGNGGRAQIRMIDKALISLQENSVLQIKNYQYQPGGKNNSVLLELLSGGLRTITGAIGKGNKKAYELRTPLATIGIRGTDYEVEIVSNGMYVAVWDGVIHLRARQKNGCNMLIGRSQPFMFIFIDRLGKCKGLSQVPDVFASGHSSNIPNRGQADFVAGRALARQLVIEPLVQKVPAAPVVVPPVTPPVVIPPVVVNPPVIPPIVVPPVIPPAVVTYNFNGLVIDQSRPSTALTANVSALNISNPVFKVGLNLFKQTPGNTTADFIQSVGGLPVSWGHWANFSTSLANKSLSSSSSNGLIWATYDPTDPAIVNARTGSFSRYETMTDSLVNGSLSSVSNLQVQMDVNFESGAVSNGALSANTANDTWLAVFDGNIQSGDLSLQLNGASVIDSTPSNQNPARDASGFISGDFVGNNASSIIGAFGLSEDANASNHIEGVFVVEEQ